MNTFLIGALVLFVAGILLSLAVVLLDHYEEVMSAVLYTGGWILLIYVLGTAARWVLGC